jgi:hypothetical protein
MILHKRAKVIGARIMFLTEKDLWMRNSSFRTVTSSLTAPNPLITGRRG